MKVAVACVPERGLKESVDRIRAWALAFLACGLFLKAIEAGHAVLFMTLRELAQVLEAPRLPGQHNLLRRYAQPKLLVIDEVGYMRLTSEQVRVLFDALGPWAQLPHEKPRRCRWPCLFITQG